MAKKETIQKVTAALLAPLPPVDGLRKAVLRKRPLERRMEELLAHEEDEEFIVQAYRNLLGRDPEQEGIENWLKCLRERKLSRKSFLRNLVESEEGKTRWLLALMDMEDRVQELGLQCLGVVEHLEHRFNEPPTCQVGELQGAIHTRGHLSPRKALSKSQISLNALYDQIRVHQNQVVSVESHLAVRSLNEHLPCVKSLDGLEYGWFLAGRNVMDLVLACRNQSIPVLCALMKSTDAGYARDLGVNAWDTPFLGCFPNVDHPKIQVAWLRNELASLCDGDLLKYIAELSVLMTETGCVIVEEGIDESEFTRVRVRAAMEVSGWEQMDRTAHPTLMSTLEFADSCILLFKKAIQQRDAKSCGN